MKCKICNHPEMKNFNGKEILWCPYCGSVCWKLTKPDIMDFHVPVHSLKLNTEKGNS